MSDATKLVPHTLSLADGYAVPPPEPWTLGYEIWNLSERSGWIVFDRCPSGGAADSPVPCHRRLSRS